MRWHGSARLVVCAAEVWAECVEDMSGKRMVCGSLMCARLRSGRLTARDEVDGVALPMDGENVVYMESPSECLERM